ncbi:uncharacterized protein [Rutidosis leptorrhynchoides]|uniref:uncharacterized protein n=1 Tax=Rutidosis leptorrhynchoides TaxID=125765 RepID=UPI003A9960F6
MVESGSRHSSLSGTWQHIIAAGSSLNAAQVQFKQSFVKSVGSGSSTSFWFDQWLGESKLSSLFPRLFDLECSKEVLIKDRVIISESGALTEVRFMAMVHGVGWFIQSQDPSMRVRQQNLSNNRTTIAHSSKQSHSKKKKIEIFAWWALKKRLHVLTELDKRGIDLHSVRCPLCDDDVESVDHALIFCKSALVVWDRVFNLWNMGNFSSFSINEICGIPDNNSMSGFGKKLWQAINWICLYLIWKNRNNKIFQGKSWNPPGALNEIQTKTFEWISSRVKGRQVDWLTWLSNPSSYLQM